MWQLVVSGTIVGFVAVIMGEVAVSGIGGGHTCNLFVNKY